MFTCERMPLTGSEAVKGSCFLSGCSGELQMTAKWRESVRREWMEQTVCVCMQIREENKSLALTTKMMFKV